MINIKNLDVSRLITWLSPVLAVATLVVCLTALSGCNTTEGAGKDIKAAGQGIEDAARDAKD